ncbi:amino acid ABC transporter permease [Agrobacterium sp. OT33]|uniref:amino acid ABC transporter permease n=1 Tax=Agrobacterium sp. OT33 TaxID=2815338 RepID=UPI001A8C1AE9|nr:amino acid ABC transporter permease [Agrobacterium sp. OT33]MBO0127181.1 amino acid ABC transporter permease [Agrobacterium sp. OT33]
MLDFTIVPPFAAAILTGALWTVIIAASAAVISFAGGVLIALATLYAPRIAQYPVRFVSWVLMGTPLLLQLYFIYYGLSQIGVNIPAIWTGIIGLGLHFAVYNADIIRICILGIDNGQTEGARSIGFSKVQTLRYVIVPQAVVRALPQIGNNMIAMLKDTAVVSVLGVSELVLASQQAISETYRPFEFYLVAAAIYYTINVALEFALRRADKKMEFIR